MFHVSEACFHLSSFCTEPATTPGGRMCCSLFLRCAVERRSKQLHQWGQSHNDGLGQCLRTSVAHCEPAGGPSDRCERPAAEVGDGRSAGHHRQCTSATRAQRPHRLTRLGRAWQRALGPPPDHSGRMEGPGRAWTPGSEGRPGQPSVQTEGISAGAAVRTCHCCRCHQGTD